jgi:hypothetical protein
LQSRQNRPCRRLVAVSVPGHLLASLCGYAIRNWKGTIGESEGRLGNWVACPQGWCTGRCCMYLHIIRILERATCIALEYGDLRLRLGPRIDAFQSILCFGFSYETTLRYFSISTDQQLSLVFLRFAFLVYLGRVGGQVGIHFPCLLMRHPRRKCREAMEP